MNHSSADHTPLPVIPLESPYCLEHAEEVGQGIVMEARRHHGGDIGIQAHQNDLKISSLLRPRRRKLLTTLLGLFGLKLRADSKLCARFLMGSKDNPFRIAEIMNEMDWYYEETNYYEYIDSGYDSAKSKIVALNDWIQETVELYGEAEAKETYKRPTVTHDSGAPKSEDNSTKSATNSEVGYPQYKMVVEELVRINPGPPPRSLWSLLDTWLDHWQQGDHSYRPPSSLFALDCEMDDEDD
ncbi:hypothetical protein BGZ65_007002 [Modicella reniformis]|uniref:Uncharacterized protein n=1 Tax=Modicella reniformis TaxID=1440133 RepID=A0A9P6IVK2_9FUNG|nr:hypothetical protein BGZ65_007002 [Modicella reniformis]